MAPQDSSTTYNLLLYVLDIVKLQNAFFYKLWNAFDIEALYEGTCFKLIEQTCDIEEITRDHVILNKSADKLV